MNAVALQFIERYKAVRARIDRGRPSDRRPLLPSSTPAVLCLPSIRVIDIVRTVARYYEIETTDILGDCRLRKFTRPRQVVMYLADREVGGGMKKIGRILNRDHTVALHGSKLIARLILEDPNLARDVEMIRRKLAR